MREMKLEAIKDLFLILNKEIFGEGSDNLKKCPHCGESSVMKYGKYKGIQRFKCKSESCGRSYSNRTMKPSWYSKKNISLWNRFLKMTLCGESLQFIHESLEINIQTAFRWRHSIMSYLRENRKEPRGNIRAVDMSGLVSFKGQKRVTRPFNRREVTGVALDDEGEIFCENLRTSENGQLSFMKCILYKKENQNVKLCEWLGERFVYRSGIELVERKNLKEVEWAKLVLSMWMDRFRGVASKFKNNYYALFARLFSSKKLALKCPMWYYM